MKPEPLPHTIQEMIIKVMTDHKPRRAKEVVMALKNKGMNYIYTSSIYWMLSYMTRLGRIRQLPRPTKSGIAYYYLPKPCSLWILSEMG